MDNCSLLRNNERFFLFLFFCLQDKPIVCIMCVFQLLLLLTIIHSSKLITDNKILLCR